MSTKKTKKPARSRKTTNGAAVAISKANNTHAAKEQHHIDSMYRRLGRRLAKLRAYSMPDPAIVEAASGAYELLLKASTMLAQIPDDWQPMRGSITTAPIDVGAHLAIKEKYVPKYAGMVDEGADITVTGVVGSKLKVKTVSAGEPITTFVPRTHVQPVRTAS